MEKKSSNLYVHEWLAIVVLTSVIGGLAVLTSGSQLTQNSNLKPQFEGIEVFVKGAVEYPGVYRLPSELTMQELLDLVHVKPEADLRKYNLARPIQKGRLLNIPERTMITVHVRGAVKEKISLRLPKGSSLEELIPLVALDEKANLKTLQKKRKLKDGEVVDVAFKTQK